MDILNNETVYKQFSNQVGSKKLPTYSSPTPARKSFTQRTIRSSLCAARIGAARWPVQSATSCAKSSLFGLSRRNGTPAHS
jgi:hypothetical protein